jgi:hypothetical protein
MQKRVENKIVPQHELPMLFLPMLLKLAFFVTLYIIIL